MRARVRLMPRALDQALPAIRQVFPHEWAPVEALAGQLGLLLPTLWSYLLSLEGGYALISTGRSEYSPGYAEIRGRPVSNVAVISLEDLAAGNTQPLHVLGHLIDHALGCRGEARGRWLSEGGGIVPAWQEAGARLTALFALGYGADEVARSDVRDYLAQSLAIYCLDHRRLNVADPLMWKWLRSTLFDEHFWRIET